MRGARGHRDRRLIDLTHERIIISLPLSSLVRRTAHSQLRTLTGDTLVGDVGFGDHISHVGNPLRCQPELMGSCDVLLSFFLSGQVLEYALMA